MTSTDTEAGPMQNVKSLQRHGYHRSIWVDKEGHELHIWSKGFVGRQGFGMWPKEGDTLPYLMVFPEDLTEKYRSVKP